VLRHWPAIVLILFLPIWSIGLFHRDLWMPDEPREFDIAVNMMRDHDLVVPHLAGEPFLEKPPLTYWLQSASLQVLGSSPATARVPNLLYATLAILCIGMLAGDLAPRDSRSQAAVFGAITFGTMCLVLQVDIWLATDAPLLAMTAAALLSTWRLAYAQTPLTRAGWAIALGSSLAGAFLTKNGFGLLVPGAAALCWSLWEKRPRLLLQWPMLLAVGWFALCAGLWIAALAQRPQGSTYVHILLWDNLVTRFLPVDTNASDALGHRSSHWQLLLLLPVYVLPWTFAWWKAARWSFDELRSKTSPSQSAIRFCISATLPACIVLVLSRTARDVYFAPALIGGSLLTALWFAVRTEQSKLVAYAAISLLALAAFEVTLFPTIDRIENLASLVHQAKPRLRMDRVALYCGDETIRATLDYAAGLRLPNVCTPTQAAQLIAEHPEQEFLTALRAPPRARPAPQAAIELERLGLRPVAEWHVPGGRRYALYGSVSK
jgi:4-amino-4-deoxy-L-arabinose transferase-like glycosyltransferase